MYVFHDETRRIKNITNQVRLQMSCQLYDYILNIYTFKHLHANIFYDKNSWLSKDFCFFFVLKTNRATQFIFKFT